ncbi:MAG: hypothetical protein V2A76_18355, partial [Planctomycetota bacterium]
PVDQECMAEVAGVARPTLVSGPLQGRASPSALLPWAETGSVAGLRPRFRGPPPAGEPDVAMKLWNPRPPRAEVVAEVNHRGFCLELGRSLGCALDGARLLLHPADLERHLAQGGADASALGKFVLKAPWSSSGRDRAILRPEDLEDPARRVQIGKMFAANSELLFEPWMERRADFGCAAFVDGEVELIGLHSQEVDPRDGRFVGLLLEQGEAPFSMLGVMERTTLEETAREVGARLRERGYRGPFGVDAWRYQTAGGGVGFHPLGEINARMTMGLLAHVLVRRIVEHRGEPFTGQVRLRLGKEMGESCSPERTTVLLRPGPSDAPGAWLEWRLGVAR